ncbi:hypothetical protein [uncultured Brachybacterium sp.]|uniref:hypothetical protein n=1 Tax=uncultured Brachybacterium sp. TaxID=189680 RepID=UPI0026247582|nr:hypothetical protein [uncultured Brachybacterium sp.]
MDRRLIRLSREPLRHQGFRLFWSSGTLTFLGVSVTMVVADALIITELEATESQVLLVRAAQFLLYPLNTLFGTAVSIVLISWALPSL